MPEGRELWRWGIKIIFFEYGQVAYQINGLNRMQVKFSPLGQTGHLGVRSKGQISLNFSYKVNYKDFLYQTLCVCSQIKDRKHI